MNIFVIGTGNVAYSLVPALKNAGHNIVGVYGRSQDKVRRFADLYGLIPVYDTAQITPCADIYIICTADKGIVPTAAVLKTKNIVIHTSGSTDINILKRFFQKCGVMYPVQTFTTGRMADLSQVPLLVEASDEICEQKILRLAQSISQDVRPMTSAQRKCLHLSAVFACNFTNHIIAAAKVLMAENNVDFNLLEPLMTETINKALTSDPILGQSGPAVRRDTGIMNFHLEMLNTHPTLKKIYSYMSESIMEFSDTYKDGIPRETEED
ncbi:MAG: DUF2520 domain-containing protein [Bacteroidales bacterium]|nr:DUF2520 domain-containing protein [Bacteroidales bacterium]